MAISFTNIGVNAQAATGTIAVTVGAGGVPAGVVIAVAIGDAALVNPFTGTMTDSHPNSYSAAQSNATNNNTWAAIFHADNVSALVNTNTITYTTINGSDAVISAMYVSGTLTASPLDTAVTAAASGSGTSPTVTSGTPAVSNEGFLGWAIQASDMLSFTQDTTHGWAAPFNSAGVGSGLGVSGAGGSLVNSGTGTKIFAPTFGGGSGGYSTIIVGFEPGTTSFSMTAATGNYTLTDEALSIGPTLGRYLICGFEVGDGSELSVGSGTVQNNVANFVNGGAYALKFTTTATGIATSAAFTGFSDTNTWGKVYWMVDNVSSPATENGFGLFEFWDAAFANQLALLYIEQQTNGTFNLAVYDHANTRTAGPSLTINANQWYRFEFFINISTSVGVLNVMKDGTPTWTLTGQNYGNTNIANVLLGAGYNPETAGYNYYYDDFELDFNGFPGASKVIARQGRPFTPTYNNWTLVGGNTIDQVWSDTPFSATKDANSGSITGALAQTMPVASFSQTQVGHGSGQINPNCTVCSIKVGGNAKASSTSNSINAGNIRRRFNSVDTDVAVTLTTADAYYETAPFLDTLTNINSAEIGWNKSASSVAGTQTVEDMWMNVSFIFANPTQGVSAQGIATRSGGKTLGGFTAWTRKPRGGFKEVNHGGYLLRNRVAFSWPHGVTQDGVTAFKFWWWPAAAVSFSMSIGSVSYSLTDENLVEKKGSFDFPQAGFYTLTDEQLTLKKGSFDGIQAGFYTLTGEQVTEKKTSLQKVQAGFYTTSTQIVLKKTSLALLFVGNYTLTVEQVQTLKGSKAFAQTVFYSLTGENITEKKTSLLNAQFASYALNPETETLKKASFDFVQSGSYALTDETLTTKKGSLSKAQTVFYNLTGENVTERKTSIANVQTVFYTTTSQPVLKKASLDSVQAGFYSFTGEQVQTLKGSLIKGQTGFFSLTGENVTLLWKHLNLVQAGFYSLTDEQLTLKWNHLLNVQMVPYTLTGESLNFLTAITAFFMNISAGTYTLTDNNLTLLKTSLDHVQTTTYALTDEQLKLLKASLDNAQSGFYSLNGENLTLTAAHRANVQSGFYSLTGEQLTLKAAHAQFVQAGFYTVTGEQVKELKASKDFIGSGSYALNGENLTLLKASREGIQAGFYTLTDESLTLLKASAVFTSAGFYTLTDENLVLKATRRDNLQTGFYNLTGESLALTFSGQTAFFINLGAGTYSLTPSNETLLKASQTILFVGNYALAGENEKLLRGAMLDPLTTIYSLTGEQLTELKKSNLNAQSVSYQFTVESEQLAHGRTISLASGSYTLTGEQVRELTGHLAKLGAGSYLVTGEAVNLTIGGVVITVTISPVLFGSATTPVLTGTPTPANLQGTPQQPSLTSQKGDPTLFGKEG